MRVLVAPVGWVYIVLVLDSYIKKIVGDYVGLQVQFVDWVLIVNRVVNHQLPQALQGHRNLLMG